jgi:hypothetical protein
MDLYLPNDFFQLRNDLPDWRDAPATHDSDARHAPAEPRDCADPLWQVF